MTEEKKKTTGSREPKIRKVTTGAWWKSAKDLLVGKKQAEDEQQNSGSEPDKVPAASKAKEQPVDDSGRKEQTGDEPPVTETTDDRSRKKGRSRSRSTRKAESHRDGESAGDKRDREDDTGVSRDPSSGETAESETRDAAVEEEPAAKKGRSRSRSSGRRGRSRKKSEEVKPAQEPSARETSEESGDGENVQEKNSGRRKSSNGGTRQKQQRSQGKEPKTSSGKNDEKIVTKLLINAEEPEECRIALVEDGRLQSFHVNTVVRERTKNNIYKGRIVSVEANLQAAFVDIGTGRNGFLPFSDIHPEYYKEDVDEHSRELIAKKQWKKLKIENVIKRGQEVLVQVVKEVTGNKGANMTTYLSLPGRYLVLMPGSDSSGISRKIAGEERRAQLRDMMSSFNIPEGIGFIVRTASADITKTALQQDLRYLLRLWKEIKKRGQTMEAPALIYEDQDIVVRFLRDHFVPEIQEILVDTQDSFDQVQTFVELLPAKQRQVRIRLHRGAKPIFNQHNVEEQIESIYQPQVPLPSGGSIVINPTEALVAIDVNSGRTSKNGDFEETIFLANMEAADELARQLRLRDLGGLIVVDFIDMRNKKHIREVEKQVKAAMKRDKAKVDISRISRFGLMQISRQKMGAPIEKGSYRRCEYCQGRGVIRSVETLALYYLRRIQTGISRKKVNRVEARLPLEVAHYLLNKKRTELAELESRHEATIDIIPRPEMKPGDNQLEFLAA
ncbi:Rne/Rng family ribonuclease [Desulfolithobacter sp.]